MPEKRSARQPARGAGVVTLAHPVPAAVLTVTTAASITDDGSYGPDQNPDDNIALEETEISTPGGKRRERSWWREMVLWLADLFLQPIEDWMHLLLDGLMGVEWVEERFRGRSNPTIPPSI